MTTATAEEKPQHALCSASSAERWLTCPGSLWACKDLPPSPSSPRAEEGTRAHALSEELFKLWERGGRAPLAYEALEPYREQYADTVEEGPNGEPWSMVDYATTYFTACVEELARFEPDTMVYHAERRLVLDRELGMFGTADLMATGKVAGEWWGLICDLKYGRSPVYVKKNKQFAYYAAALATMSKRPLVGVRVVMVQPRLRIWRREIEYTREELQEWTKTLKEGADKALRMRIGLLSPEFSVGGHCWFCPAREHGKCEAYATKHQRDASEGFEEVKE